ncbi:hypothetical protein T265_15189, partial [Opisthorchis viverrini]
MDPFSCGPTIAAPGHRPSSRPKSKELSKVRKWDSVEFPSEQTVYLHAHNNGGPWEVSDEQCRPDGICSESLERDNMVITTSAADDHNITNGHNITKILLKTFNDVKISDRNPTAGSTTLHPEETCVTSELELAYETSGPTSLSDIDVMTH